MGKGGVLEEEQDCARDAAELAARRARRDARAKEKMIEAINRHKETLASNPRTDLGERAFAERAAAEAAGAAAHESEELQKERDDLAGKVKALESELETVRAAAATAKSVAEKTTPVFTVSQEPCEFRSSTGQNRTVDAEVVTAPASFLCERTMCNTEMMTVPVMSKADM